MRFGRQALIVHVATTEDLWLELGRPLPPTAIWQLAFDYDPEHLHSLCRCQTEGRPLDHRDLYDDALDLSYEEIQSGLFVLLLHRLP